MLVSTSHPTSNLRTFLLWTTYSLSISFLPSEGLTYASRASRMITPHGDRDFIVWMICRCLETSAASRSLFGRSSRLTLQTESTAAELSSYRRIGNSNALRNFHRPGNLGGDDEFIFPIVAEAWEWMAIGYAMYILALWSLEKQRRRQKQSRATHTALTATSREAAEA